jgi:hypothetical protein
MRVYSKTIQPYKLCLSSIFKLFKEIFPFENKKVFLYFKKYFKEQENNLKHIKKEKVFFIFIKKALAGLKNSHTKLGGYPWKTFKPVEHDVVWIENKFYLRKMNKIIGEILLVDKKTPGVLLKGATEMISGSTDWYLRNQGLKFILADKKQRVAEVKIKIGDKIYTKNIKRELVNYKEKKFCEKKITNGIIYFKVPVWRNIGQVLEQRLEFFIKNGARVLIIDLRGNMGGNSAESDILASHFFRKKVLFGTADIRSNNKDLKLKKHYYFINPQKSYWDISIILMVDSECFSSSELFIAGMKDNRRALVIGETTGGGSGNPKKFTIPCGKLSLEIFVSTWNYRRINGQSIEGNGVEPDIFITPTLTDLTKEKDIVLERAILEARKLI